VRKAHDFEVIYFYLNSNTTTMGCFKGFLLGRGTGGEREVKQRKEPKANKIKKEPGRISQLGGWVQNQNELAEGESQSQGPFNSHRLSYPGPTGPSAGMYAGNDERLKGSDGNNSGEPHISSTEVNSRPRLEQHSEGCCRSAQELEKLRSEHNGLIKRHQMLQGESDHLKLTQIELNQNNATAAKTISRLESELKTVQDYIPHLVQRLSEEDQALFNQGGTSMAWVLQSCLNQFESNYKWYQEEFRRLNESYQSQITDLKQSHHTDLLNKQNEFRVLKEAHQTRIGELNQSHQNAINNQGRRHREEKKEIHDRLGSEVDRLQRALLTTVDDFRPIPDADLKARYSTLTKAVGDLARCPLDVNAEELGYAFDGGDFIKTTPQNHWRFLLESKFWIILEEGFFSNPFRVFGSYGDQYLNTWRGLFEKGEPK
jgi:hypothetical protein